MVYPVGSYCTDYHDAGQQNIKNNLGFFINYLLSFFLSRSLVRNQTANATQRIRVRVRNTLVKYNFLFIFFQLYSPSQ
jgi:hypothetical protein